VRQAADRRSAVLRHGPGRRRRVPVQGAPCGLRLEPRQVRGILRIASAEPLLDLLVTARRLGNQVRALGHGQGARHRIVLRRHPRERRARTPDEGYCHVKF